MSEQIQREDGVRMDYITLEEACRLLLSGVAAASPEIYKRRLELIAKATNREFNDDLKRDVREVCKKFPCPID